MVVCDNTPNFGFLVGTLLKGTQDTIQQVAEIIQAEEEVIPSDKEQQEPAWGLVIVDLEEDFRVFNQTNLTESSKASLNQVSTNQEILNVPEGMVIQKRTPNLLTLLESHAGSATPELLDP